MPQRINKVSDIGNSMKFSSVYDADNIYLSEEGWVYRHYKSQDLSRWWDEILVAGEVDAATNSDVQGTNPPNLGDPSYSPIFEVGDGKKDFEYSDTEKSDGTVVPKFVVADTSDNVPFPPAIDEGDSNDSDDLGGGSAAAPMG